MQTFTILWLVILSAAAVMLFLGAGQLTARLVAAEKQIAELRGELRERERGQQRAVGRIEWADGSRCLVLAVEPKCLACAERLGDFARLAPDGQTGDRYIVLSPTDPDLSVENDRIEIVADDSRFGELAITATPTILTFDADGQELSRTIAGNKDALARAIERFELVGAGRPQ